MKRSVAALLAVALLACGGDHSTVTEPPPPPPAAPPSPITRLVLADTSALVFTGSSVTGRAFVAHAYDATGAEVADPTLTLAAGSGWTVRGDTLIAPTTEGRTTLRISATRGALPAASEWAHFDVVGADSAAADSLTVTAGIDLRDYHWTATWSCKQGGWISVRPDAMPLDSLQYIGETVDSVVYASDSGWVWNYGGVAQVWLSGTVYGWRRDGAVDTIATGPFHHEIASEAPDTLVLMAGYNNPDDPGASLPDGSKTGPLDRWPAAKVSDSPLTYAGGNWCTGSTPTSASGITLTAAP